MGALAAATAGGGAALGMADLGHLTVGSVADLVVVDGDPITDIRVLLRPSRIRLVIRGGVIVAGRDLDGPTLGVPPPCDDEPLAPPASNASPCGCGLLSAAPEPPTFTTRSPYVTRPGATRP
jgi:hypothetical protein